MARRICKICGKPLALNEGFQVPTDPKRYCCSQDEYNQWVAEKINDQAVTDKIFTIISEMVYGVTRGDAHANKAFNIAMPKLKKEWEEWNKLATNMEIFAFLSFKRESIESGLQNKYTTEWATPMIIGYISGCIKNGMMDFLNRHNQTTNKIVEKDCAYMDIGDFNAPDVPIKCGVSPVKNMFD